MSITVNVKVDRKHDLKPDVRMLDALITGWINTAIGDEVDDKKHLPFQMQVVRISAKTRGFNGVKIRERLNNRNLEVIVRPNGSEVAYICHVTCPNNEISRMITSCYRPAVDECGNELCDDQPRDQVEDNEPRTANPVDSDLNKIPKKLARAVRELCNDTNLPIIAFLVRGHMNETGRKTISETEIVEIVFESVLGREKEDRLASATMIGILESQVFRPVPSKNGVPYFIPTKRLTEQANQFQLRLQQEEYDLIDTRIASNEKLLSATEREMLRLEQDYKKKKAELLASQQSLKTKLAELQQNRDSVPLVHPLFGD